MPVYNAALAILDQPSVRARVQTWLVQHPLPPVHVAPDAAGWWRRYCFSVLTSLQPIYAGFWEAFYADEDWMAVANAGPDDRRPPVATLQALLRRHSVRRHLNKGEWIHRAWNDLDVGALATAAAPGVPNPAGTRAAELAMVDTLLRESRRIGVGPKVARLMMIWDPEHGAMGHSYRNVVPLDRRWIIALRQQGVNIEPNLSVEASYREVETAICAAASAAGMLPFLADGAVFGWME